MVKNSLLIASLIAATFQAPLDTPIIFPFKMPAKNIPLLLEVKKGPPDNQTFS